ncbi:MAG: hypothetical protein ABL867_06840 [Rickettsiales bacterium]
MIKDNTPDLEQFKKILDGGDFDYNLPSGHHRLDNNRRLNGREEENNHGGANGKKTTLSSEEANLAGLIRAKQQQLKAAIAGDPSLAEHVDPSLLIADPTSMKGESLKALLVLVSSAHKEVKVEEGDDESFIKNLLNRCKNLLFGKKHCHDNKSVVASPISSAINKDMVNVAMQELGGLTTPLMLRNVGNIDPGFVVDPDNTRRRKQQQSVMV